MDNPTEDLNRIQFSPPLIYLSWAILATILNQLLPIRLQLENVAIQWLAFSLLALGVIVALIGFITFAIHDTSYSPNAKAQKLLKCGLFRISRNPIYLGFTIVYLGAICKSSNGWMLAIFPFLIMTMNLAVIAKEEQKLLSKFGVEYEQYCNSVRRWI